MRKPKKVAAKTKKAKRLSAAPRGRKRTRSGASALSAASSTVTEALFEAGKAEAVTRKTPLVQITLDAARRLLEDAERLHRKKEITDARLVMFDQCFAMFTNRPPYGGAENRVVSRGQHDSLNELRYAIALVETPPPPLPNSDDEPATF